MKRLRENLTSRYWEAAQRLQPRQSRRKIVAYVESYEDIAFWRHILGRLEDETRYFQIMLPDARALAKGKRQALMSALRDVALGRNIIACVDSDYDYLLQRATHNSRQLNGNPYFFQTYAYAIENYHCYAPALHEACTTATLNDANPVDLEAFMAHYSRTIFPLFLWNIHFYRQRREGCFPMGEFNQTVRLEHFDPFAPPSEDRAEATPHRGQRPPRHRPAVPPKETLRLPRLRHRVERTLRQLEREYPQERGAVARLEGILGGLGVKAEETYLYIQGHHLLDNVVTPLLTPICSRLRNQREEEIRRLAHNREHLQNELSAYHNALTPLSEALKKNFGFALPPELPPYLRLLGDLRKRLDEEEETGKEGDKPQPAIRPQ